MVVVDGSKVKKKRWEAVGGVVASIEKGRSGEGVSHKVGQTGGVVRWLKEWLG